MNVTLVGGGRGYVGIGASPAASPGNGYPGILVTLRRCPDYTCRIGVSALAGIIGTRPERYGYTYLPIGPGYIGPGYLVRRRLLAAKQIPRYPEPNTPILLGLTPGRGRAYLIAANRFFQKRLSVNRSYGL